MGWRNLEDSSCVSCGSELMPWAILFFHPKSPQQATLSAQERRIMAGPEWRCLLIYKQLFSSHQNSEENQRAELTADDKRRVASPSHSSLALDRKIICFHIKIIWRPLLCRGHNDGSMKWLNRPFDQPLLCPWTNSGSMCNSSYKGSF